MATEWNTNVLSGIGLGHQLLDLQGIFRDDFSNTMWNIFALYCSSPLYYAIKHCVSFLAYMLWHCVSFLCITMGLEVYSIKICIHI